MKKLLLIITAFMLTASLSIGQQITFGLDDIDISTVGVGEDVVVPVKLVSMEPGYGCIGFDLFIGFDHALLTWKGTNPAPLPGVINFNPLFPPYSPADWLFNDGGVEMIVTWQDPTYLGVFFADGDVLFEYVFTYNGGLNPGESSPLIWGTSAETTEANKLITLAKGQTAAFHQFFGSFCYQR